MSLKKEIAEVLDEIADILEFKGENKFKVGAFKNGANIIRRINGDIGAMISDGSISKIKGIGKSLLSVLNDYYSHKESSDLTELKKSIPEGLGDLFNIRGLGSKKIKVLFDKLNISNLETLEHACNNNKLINIKGFSQKTQENIILEIDRIKSSASFMLLPYALKRANELINLIENLEFVEKIVITGELRRQNEIISKIQLILLTSNYNQLVDNLSNLLNYKDIPTSISNHLLNIITSDSKIIQIFVIEDKKDFEKLYFITTGSNEFLNKLKIPMIEENEPAIFSSLNIPYVAPEMRENIYFDAPDNLRVTGNITFHDFKGLLHFHTNSSDGLNSLQEMIAEAGRLNFEYAAVCDHSKSAFYANGLTENRILLQKEEINRLNESQQLRVFHGIESDILNSGELDYTYDFMHEFDFVVLSIHSNFSMSESEMTKRIIKAIESPFADLFAHPTGRLLLRRKGYPVNINYVIDACAANDVAIEINASPFRLDLDWRNIYYAREKECKFAINPDAHSTEGISNIKYGIMVAQKAGLQKHELINSFSETEFVSFLNRKIKRI